MTELRKFCRDCFVATLVVLAIGIAASAEIMHLIVLRKIMSDEDKQLIRKWAKSQIRANVVIP